MTSTSPNPGPDLPGGSYAADLAALVDRCFLAGMAGTTPSAGFRDWLAGGLGGVILFAGNIESREQLAALCADLRAAGDELIVAADEEGGDVTRLHTRDGSPNPGNLALGAIDDPELTRSVAAGIGRELADVNVTLDLAPVADVNTNPDNPVIGVRSFGSDPDLVCRHVVAYVEGLQGAGVPGSAKHFPGHGDTHVDSHLGLPKVDGDLEPHLRPFRAAIGAGVASILSAHIVYPDLDDAPATLSRRILTDLLRTELGFDGAIVTDSLTMAAIADGVGIGEGSVRALAAGADLLCMNSAYEQQRVARAHVLEAVRAGRLPEGRIVDAAARVRTLARSAGPASSPGVDWDASAVRRALLVDVPLPLQTRPYVIEAAAPRRGIEPRAASLLDALRQHDPRIDGIRLGADGLEAALEAAGERPVILTVRDAHRDPGQRALVDRARERRPDTVIVGIGTVCDAQVAPGHYLGTRGGGRINLTTAAGVLLGASDRNA